MTIYSIADIVKKPLSKYKVDEILFDLDDLKQNGGITKINDFIKLMNYFMKSKTFTKNMGNMGNVDTYIFYAEIFDKIIDMHPQNGIYMDYQMQYLCDNGIINKSLIEKLIHRGLKMKYIYIKSYLTVLQYEPICNKEETKTNINYIIKTFVDRKDIQEDEYLNIPEIYEITIESQILFNTVYFKQANYIMMADDDKNYIRDFINKFRFFDKFYNKLVNKHSVFEINDIEWKNNYDIMNKYISDNIFANTLNLNNICKNLCILNYYEIMFDPIFQDKLESKFKNNDETFNTSFICFLYETFSFKIQTDIYIKYKDFFEFYTNKFSNIVDKFKKLNNKIILNNKLLNCKYYVDICKKYDINKITINDINDTKSSLSPEIFELMYSGEYNTELLNKCIKLKYNKNLIDYFLKTKQINFNDETLRYAIYTHNLIVIQYMLDNKYNGKDTDLLYAESGQFSIDMRKLYKTYNILISDEVYKELRLRQYNILYDMCINGDDIEHMKKLDEQINQEHIKIFPFNTYHDNTDWTFYYDMAKNGELTLEIITKIHHVVGATGIKHLVRLYMEFNQFNQLNEQKNNTIQNIIENNKSPEMQTEKPKKIVTKIVKKIVKKVVNKEAE
jgi:hypothetical protein